VPLGGFSKIYK